MAVPRIRADYDQLGQAAQRFGAASEAAAATVKLLQQNMSVLEGGDWIGDGARAFYEEMSQSVFPSLQRLTNALRTAQQITQAISREMKEAENAAATVLRANGAAGAGQGAAAAASAGAGFFSGASNFSTAVADAGQSGPGGLWQAAARPIDTLQGLWQGINHPSELWDAFKQPYVEAWQGGHPFQAISGGALFTASISPGASMATGEPAAGVFQAAGQSGTWAANQAFLQQMMAQGVNKLEFHGLDIDQELVNFDGQPSDAVPAHVNEMRYLVDHASQYGYAQQGNSFVRLPPNHAPR